jgi:hypothetical protein
MEADFQLHDLAALPSGKEPVAPLLEPESFGRSQNYWASGLCPSSEIMNAMKHDVSETGSVCVFR